MMYQTRQRGVALFTVVFLIVAVGGLAVTVGLISGQQQLGSAQALDQTRAYYAARGRLDREIANLLGGGSCTTPAPDTFNGFTTVVDACNSTPIDEGVNPAAPPPPSPNDYFVHELEVRAYRGDAQAGTLVQRSIRVQVTDAP